MTTSECTADSVIFPREGTQKILELLTSRDPNWTDFGSLADLRSGTAGAVPTI